MVCMLGDALGEHCIPDSRRFRTRCSSAIRPAGSMAASPAIRCIWPARKPETLLQRAVYKFHPAFKGGDFRSGSAIPTRISATPRSKAETSCRSAKASCCRHGRAHHAPGGWPGRARTFQAQGRHAGDWLPDAEEPRGDASRYGVHLLRPRSRHGLSRSGRPDPLLQHLSRPTTRTASMCAQKRALARGRAGSPRA